jgi:hypothetical protein
LVDGIPLKILCLAADQVGHIQPVADAFGGDAVFIFEDACQPDRVDRHRPDCVMCVNDFDYGVAQCLGRARELGIPSLVLQDGILEWRCQYENPLFGSGGGAPQHQPVLADKIACIGRQSARQIAAWGNTDKVEVTGMPRLDHLLTRPPSPVRRPGRRILVMTAKKPGFTAAQTEITLRSLRDLQQYLAGRQDVEVVWRVSPAVANRLGVANQFQQASSRELREVLESVDAVLTTPSTAMLEAMLLNRPTAALDYHQVPRFVPTSWTISAAEHIPAVVDELLNPAPRKMSFQQDCLRDCLECEGSASLRVVALIQALVAVARRLRATGQPWRLPGGLLGRQELAAPSPPVPLCELYPDQALYREQDVTRLQVHLARLQKQNERLRAELARRSLLYGVRQFGKRVAGLLDSKDHCSRR